MKGDVIGVGFRAWTKIQAKIVGVHGWVRNVFDKSEIFGQGGGVEALIQGDEDKVNKMINLLKEGPPVSRVDDTEIIWEEPKEMFEEFEIRK
ncbi:acylphosphatase [Candidatus Roizmanbacteria bacterium]|nr:acylphosphatase [Candidatus Roizmanbacteria bacterium]